LLPVIIVGAGIVSGVFAAYRFCRKCSICEKKLSWTYNCLECENSVCNACAIEVAAIKYWQHNISNSGHVCSSKCKEIYAQACQNRIKRIEAEIALKSRAANVKLISNNYKGQQNPKLNKQISTEYFSEIEEAEFQIKYFAASNDVDTVWYVQRKFVRRAAGNYIYKEWMFTGYI
jgi:hypothetical protein